MATNMFDYLDKVRAMVGDNLKLRCPERVSPRYCVDPETDKGYEGSVMCNLNDKPCIVEYDNEKCQIYEDFLAKKEE